MELVERVEPVDRRDPDVPFGFFLPAVLPFDLVDLPDLAVPLSAMVGMVAIVTESASAVIKSSKSRFNLKRVVIIFS